MNFKNVNFTEFFSAPPLFVGDETQRNTYLLLKISMNTIKFWVDTKTIPDIIM